MKLLTDANAKTVKGEKFGIYTTILYLAPSRESGVINTCKFADSCASVCLYKSGRGNMPSVIKSRVRKTIEFAHNPKLFIENLASDIEEAQVVANNKGLKLAIRLNGTSDLPWESLGGFLKVNLMERFPSVIFYDYTKNPFKAELFAQSKMPKNYHLTFSRSATNLDNCDELIKLGVSIATVFNVKKGASLPSYYKGYKVIDGDISDARFLDEKGVIIGLRAKGKAIHDKSGFVVNV